jgi:hypothetical protein
VATRRNRSSSEPVSVPLNASGSSSGNVTLQIDMTSGGYGAFDNLEIAPVPEPSTLALLGGGLAGLLAMRRRHRRGGSRHGDARSSV